MSSTIVLQMYPLSTRYREKLEPLIQDRDCEFISLVELRQLQILGLARAVASKSPDTVWIPFEEASGSIILPILQALSLLYRPRVILVADHEMKVTRLSRGQCLAQALRIVPASLKGLLNWWLTYRDATRLLQEERITVSPPPARRILYFKNNLWFGVRAGGSVGHVAGVVNGFLAHGLSVQVAATEPQPTVRPEAEFCLLDAPTAYGVPQDVNLFNFSAKCKQQFPRIIASGRPDLIYHRLSLGSAVAADLSRLLKVPLIVEYNGSEVWAQQHWATKKRSHDTCSKAELAVLRHAHLVVTVSDVLADELKERGVPPERIVNYPNCVDPETFRPDRYSATENQALRDRLSIPATHKVVTFIGTFGRWHGTELMAEAVAYLGTRHPQWLKDRQVTFLFVGDGVMMPAVRKITAPFQDRCRFPGLCPQNEAPQYLAISDILMCPTKPNSDGSRFFGSPTKIFEYMAMSKTIIASDLEQIGQTLRDCLYIDGSSQPQQRSPKPVAILCPPGHVESLAQAMMWSIDNPERTSELGDNARQLVLQKYTWKRHTDEILERYEDLRVRGAL